MLFHFSSFSILGTGANFVLRYVPVFVTSINCTNHLFYASSLYSAWQFDLETSYYFYLPILADTYFVESLTIIIITHLTSNQFFDETNLYTFFDDSLN